MSIFMGPLIDDLVKAWEEGVWTYDQATKINFRMYVWYHYSLHDLPAYGIFCGWCTHGKFPCPTCKATLQFICKFPCPTCKFPCPTCNSFGLYLNSLFFKLFCTEVRVFLSFPLFFHCFVSIFFKKMTHTT